jgi:hypothetical protein
MGLTAVTTAAAVLGFVPRGVWVATLILGLALFVVAAVVWRRGDYSASPADPMNNLKGQLAAVDGVRVWLSLRDDPDERLPLDDDRVFQWAKKRSSCSRASTPTLLAPSWERVMLRSGVRISRRPTSFDATRWAGAST